MNIREKALQTVCVRIRKGEAPKENYGAAFFFGEIITEASEMGIRQARETLDAFISRATVPILLTSDFENGCGSMLKGLTPLPYLSSLGAADSLKLAYDYGKATALEAGSVGANWSFSPVSDLLINGRNPLVNVRSIGDNPVKAAELLEQVVKGMQDNGLAACAKHFPGDGVDWRDQHIVTTYNTLSEKQWKNESGYVFQKLIDSGVMSIMAGHMGLPFYQKDSRLPATLSKELISDLLKKEMGFDGVVVTDALDMGGFGGWYRTKEEGEIESFKAGCDMMLWPTEHYVDNLVRAVESGYISMERLDDAYDRIIRMKERLGLFDRASSGTLGGRDLSDDEKKFVADTQRNVAEASVTLLRDKAGVFPLNPNDRKRLDIVPVTHYAPALDEAKLMCDEFARRGFDVHFHPEGIGRDDEEASSLIIYALFSRSFRPQGFLDFQGPEAYKIQNSCINCLDKTMMVSFGSPFFDGQYFERCLTSVNAYSMLSPSVKAFVKAACGEIGFGSYSPFTLPNGRMRSEVAG